MDPIDRGQFDSRLIVNNRSGRGDLCKTILGLITIQMKGRRLQHASVLIALWKSLGSSFIHL